VHRDHTVAPKGLADALEGFLKTLLEEQIIFPAIRDGFAGSLFGPIAVMRHEHDHYGEDMRAIEVLAHGFEPPENVCNLWRALYSGLDTFRGRICRACPSENNVLLPRFERVRGRA
jgi:regulator of cell morphogenesis and NO signaling